MYCTAGHREIFYFFYERRFPREKVIGCQSIKAWAVILFIRMFIGQLLLQSTVEHAVQLPCRNQSFFTSREAQAQFVLQIKNCKGLYGKATGCFKR